MTTFGIANCGDIVRWGIREMLKKDFPYARYLGVRIGRMDDPSEVLEELVKAERPKVLLIGLDSWPEENLGLTRISEFRQQSPETPIVVLSWEIPIREEAMKLGCFAALDYEVSQKEVVEIAKKALFKQQPWILVVERLRYIRQSVKEVLEGSYFNVLAASSIEEAEGILDEKQPDVCLFGMSWNDNPMAGLQIANYIRGKNYPTLLIAMTVDPRVLKSVRKLGLSVIAKDLPLKDFIAELKRIINPK